MSAPIILVPGFWLGAWAWDEVVSQLQAAGHTAIPVTLPGLESAEADRSKVTIDDHVVAICDAVRAAGERPILAVHSGAGVSGYGASDRIPSEIAAMVYVDTGPATAPIIPGFEGAEWPLPSWEELSADPGNKIDLIPEAKLREFRERAVPEPGAAVRDVPALTNESRVDVPSYVICSGYSSDQIKQAVLDGMEWVGGLKELRNVAYIDLPGSHWVMWSNPKELAEVLGEIATRHG